MEDETQIEDGPLGLLELLTGASRSPVLAALIEPELRLHYLPSRQVAYPSDRGTILTHQEWARLRGLIDGFYRIMSQDAVEVVNRHARRYQQTPERTVDITTARGPGYIYVVQAQDGLYRIGMCTNIREKIARIKEQQKRPAKIIHYFRVKDMRITESRLREQYAPKRLRKNEEWLRLTEADVAWLKSQKDEVERQGASPPSTGGAVVAPPAGGAPVIDIMRKKRYDSYWGTLRRFLKVIKREEEQGRAIYRIMKDVDTAGWTDEGAFLALEDLVNDPTRRGNISAMAWENYLPTFMTRRERGDDGGTKVGSKKRRNDINRQPDEEPLRVGPSESYG